MRALSSATLSFGRVSIPVKLYSAYESDTRRGCRKTRRADAPSPGQQLALSQVNREVHPDAIVGYEEFAERQLALFPEEELKGIERAATHKIDILEFVRAGQFQRKYLDRVYFLGASRGGTGAYKALADRLRKTDRTAIARYASRGTEHVVMLRPEGHGLAMEQIHGANDMPSILDLPMADSETRQKELRLSLQLIRQAATVKRDSANSREDRPGRITEMIGHRPAVSPAKQIGAKVIDIAMKQHNRRGERVD